MSYRILPLIETSSLDLASCSSLTYCTIHSLSFQRLWGLLASFSRFSIRFQHLLSFFTSVSMSCSFCCNFIYSSVSLLNIRTPVSSKFFSLFFANLSSNKEIAFSLLKSTLFNLNLVRFTYKLKGKPLYARLWVVAICSTHFFVCVRHHLWYLNVISILSNLSFWKVL